jgi:hypothetical protein
MVVVPIIIGITTGAITGDRRSRLATPAAGQRKSPEPGSGLLFANIWSTGFKIRSSSVANALWFQQSQTCSQRCEC